MNSNLPKFYERLFRWFCEPGIYEELQGDLEEGFEENLKVLGLQKARKTTPEQKLKVRNKIFKQRLLQKARKRTLKQKLMSKRV